MSKILVVDDDAAVRGFVSKALEREGHQVIEAPEAVPALELLAEETVDLVITDFMMPGMNGIEFLARLRERPPSQTPGPKFIIITGHQDPEVVLGALREQVSDFLSKPFGVEELYAAVRGALEAQVHPDVEVVSALPEWVELRVPCVFESVTRLVNLLGKLARDLPPDTQEAVGLAFREMLNNAVEHGGKLDPKRTVSVTCIRLKGAMLYHIRDPGEGFDPGLLEHAAVGNPDRDLLRHSGVRDQKGMRPGGFGILLTRQLVDELVYNERRNEVILVKYLR